MLKSFAKFKPKMKKAALTFLSMAIILTNLIGLSGIEAFAAFTSPISVTEVSATERIYTYEDFTINYSFQSRYDGTRIVTLVITNTGTELIENFALHYDFGGTVTSTSECSVFTEENGFTYLKGLGYNSDIAPNQSRSFSYNLAAGVTSDFPETFSFVQTRMVRSGSDYSASLTLTSAWDNYINGFISLSNLSDSAVEAWELDFACNFTITASYSSDIEVIVTPAGYQLKGSYNKNLAAGSSVILSFAGQVSSQGINPVIENLSLSGIGVNTNLNIEIEEITTVEELEEINDDFEYFESEESEEGKLISVVGKFSDIPVTNRQSAVMALHSVKSWVGMSDPTAELEFDSIYDSSISDYKTYYFDQIYDNVSVYERGVTVAAHDNGDTFSLDSNFYGFYELENKPSDSQKQVLGIDNSAELIIYTFGEYEDDPVWAYQYPDGDDTVIVLADDGQVIEKSGVSPALADRNNPNGQAPAIRSIYDVPLGSKEYDYQNNLIYSQGSFGQVDGIQNNNPTLVLSNDEKNELKINDMSIGFEFAEKKEAHFLQTIPDDEYDEFISDPGRRVVTGIYDLNYDYQDSQGNWYVDVGVDEYNFVQIYNGRRVYGRIITQTVNDEGETIIMDSNVLSHAVLQSVNTNPGLLVDDIRNSNSTLANLELEVSEPVIYSWEGYESNPTLVYIFLDRDNGKTYIVSAADGSILLERELGKGLDEGEYRVERKLRYFPITADGKLTAEKPNGNYINTIKVTSKNQSIESDTTFFYEPEAVSIYFNIEFIYDFYVEKMNHHSYDNNKYNRASTITLAIKEESWAGAAAAAGSNHIETYGRQYRRIGYGAGLHTMGHEYNHMVYRGLNNSSSSGYKAAAINEGHSNLYGNIVTSWQSTSDTSFPSFDADFSITDIKYLIDLGHTSSGFGHSLSSFVVHPAYLMKNSGKIEEDEVTRLYYTSMSMGKYSNSSNLNSVRINVIKAAIANRFTNEQMQVVTSSLNKLWTRDKRRTTLTVNVRDYDDNSVISNAQVMVRETSSSTPYDFPNGTPGVFFADTVWLNISAPGYVNYNYYTYTQYQDSTITIRLVKDTPGNGYAEIGIADFINLEPYSGTVEVFTYNENFDEIKVAEYSTDQNGSTGTQAYAPGYYFGRSTRGVQQAYNSCFTVSSGKTSSPVSYTDMDTEEADRFYIVTNYYKEGTIAQELELNPAVLSNYLDGNGNRIARGALGATTSGHAPHFMIYKIENQEFEIGYNITSSQRALLERIAQEESWITNGSGKLFNIEVTIPHQERVAPGSPSTIVITADDLLSGTVAGQTTFYKIADVTYDTQNKLYLMSL